jgi:glycosyltransferase involved in cell wall biosynthesis
MRNESQHIEGLVEDIARQDFRAELELLVADGDSSDDSVNKLHAAATRHGIDLTVLNNPHRWVSHGLNLCLGAARGDLIVRLDCHSRYPSDYLRRCIEVAEETGAENVGGVFVAIGRTTMERAVSCAMDSPFGGIHWTRHGSRRAEVDTVPYGAFRPEAFDLAGTFDEALQRNQDDEFNLRLRGAGGHIVLDPSIRVLYTPRGSFRRVFRQYYEYGRWKPAVMRIHGRPTSVRSLVPAMFVSSLALLAPLAVRSPTAARAFAFETSAYVVSALAFGTVAVRRRRERWTLVPRVAAVFPTFHIAHGLGMLVGLLRRTPRHAGSASNLRARRLARPLR